MSEVKYKAVPCSGNNCDGCINNTDNGVYECYPFIEARIKEGLPDCCSNKEYIYQIDTERDTSTVTLDQAREKFESSEGNWENSSYNGQYYNGTVQTRWESYQQALKDHGILAEGE